MKQTRKSVNYFDSIFEKNKNSEFVVYKKSSFYPCIQIEVITVERSREDMGALEMAILKLIRLGISDATQIAKLTGFNRANKLNALIGEMIGYGMITLENNKLFISKIGQDSISSGHQMIATKASLLLCGITGRLLPKTMYGARRVEADELSSRVGFRYLIDEKPTIPLSSLDLTGVDKRKYNLKDEVAYIESYLDYTQVFLEADIAVYQNSSKNYIPEISINKDRVDWDIDTKRLLYEISIDTFKLSNLTSEFKAYFDGFGFDVACVKEQEFNCVEINSSSISSGTLKRDFSGHPILAYIGTFSSFSSGFEHMPIGLSRLPFLDEEGKKDKKLSFSMQGQMFYLTTTSDEILTKALIYRKLCDIRFEFFKISYENRSKKFSEYFSEKIECLEFDNPLIWDVIDNYLPQKFKNMIYKTDNE